MCMDREMLANKRAPGLCCQNLPTISIPVSYLTNGQQGGGRWYQTKRYTGYHNLYYAYLDFLEYGCFSAESTLSVEE